jgi:hypothetical protein
MDKLRELHLPHSQFWDCYNDEPLEEDHALKSAEITTDVAVKFAEWLDKHQYVKFAIYEDQTSQTTYKYSKWDKSYKESYEIIESETKTTQELFEEFINNHYGK